MDSYATLRKHALLLIGSILFSTAMYCSTTVLTIASNIVPPPCIGNTLSYYIILSTPDVTVTLTDNDLTDGVDITAQNCLSCVSPSISGTFLFSVTLQNSASAIVGNTVIFTVTLEDPSGISELSPSGLGTQIDPNTLQLDIPIQIDDIPSVAITPGTLELCNNGTQNLTALNTNHASANSYLWSADNGNGSFSGGNPGNSPVAVAQAADTYRVMVGNQCGSRNAFVVVTNNNTPDIQMDCMDNGDGTTTITADILNAATGTTVRFFNNSMLHTTSNNNDGPDDDPSITVSNAMFNTQVFTISGNNSCGNASIMGSCLILPVELVYFRGEAVENSIYLSWATATETNNDFFTVERSEDGRNFHPVGIVEGAGNSQQEQRYELEDKDIIRLAGSNTLYYRLKQTDYDGQFTYSEIIVLTIEPQLKFDILQYHFQDDFLKLSIINPTASPLNLQLLDFNGRLVRQMQLPPQQGRTEVSLSVPNLKAGFYIIKVNKDHQSVSKKLAKVD